MRPCGGSCIPIAAESCWNGVDDDCDSKIDCADSDCDTKATCVPDVPPGFALVARVKPAEACPAGYTAKTTSLLRGPSSPSQTCTGCKCTPKTTVCRPELFVYRVSVEECQADTLNAGGVPVMNEPTSTTCVRAADLDTELSTYGVRIARMEMIDGGCAVDARNARPPALSFSDSAKLCQLSSAGAGCAAGSICVPNVASATPRCGLISGAQSCPASYRSGGAESDWLTGVTDNRRCTCTCGAAGASCAGAHVEIGNDDDCNVPSPRQLQHAGEKYCETGYSPPMRMGGTADPATCTPDSTVTDDIVPQGRHTLCCAAPAP
jgi:hypothetical protein